MGEQIPRYPDPAIEIIDPAFARLVLFNAAIERLWTGGRWGEGPVWFGDARVLYWSDIPNDRILRWDEATGAVATFRQGSNNANGNTRDRQGRLVTCEHRTRRVTRTEHDGSITVAMDAWQGKRLNSPNDVVTTSDGAIWFTDPTFGIRGYYEGEKAQQESGANVYRIDATGRASLVADDIDQPNGICFSPDETRCYIVESGTRPRRIRVYDVIDGARLTNGRVFFAGDGDQAPDGFRCDVDGNLWCGWGGGEKHDGVTVFAASGDLIGRIHLPERCANLCFGGAHRNRLFMAASRSLYALYLNTQGAPGG